MSTKDFFRDIVSKIQAKAQIRSVYGEPIETRSKTIIPVARVSYGFGGGFGNSKDANDSEGSGGMGGGVHVEPIGVMEIKEDSTTFLPIHPYSTLLKGFVVGMSTGILTGLYLSYRNQQKKEQQYKIE
ncbi:MAG: hypothetical protein JJT94_05610 [Bernardetiaceae bacterium]|nr:hypothetical protein [Bernardetiaceae bacterium]